MSTALMGIGKPHEGCIPAGAGTDICSSEQRVMSTALMGIGKPHEGCIPAGAGTDICSSEQRVVIVV